MFAELIGGTEVVYDVGEDAHEHVHVAYLHTTLDVLLDYLRDYLPHVRLLRVAVRELERLGEAAKHQALFQVLAAGGARLDSEELPHAQPLAEVQREHLELDVASRELGNQLSREQV